MTAQSSLRSDVRVADKCRVYVDVGGVRPHTSRKVSSIAEAVDLANELRALGFNPWISIHAYVAGYSFEEARSRAKEQE